MINRLAPAALIFCAAVVTNPAPAAVEGMRQPFRSRISAGGFHTCAIKSDGKLYCWGRNNYGQVGDNSLIDRLTPVFVSNGVNVIAVAAGNNHTCLLSVAGTVACWGRNQYGQLGDGGFADRRTPFAVPNLSGVVRIAAGEAHTCAVLVSGEVRCWGRNHAGQLGNNSLVGSAVPVTVVRATGGSLNGIQDLALGINHSCALPSNGDLYCWGNNAEGQTGVAAGANIMAAEPVQGLPSEVIQIAAGARHTCAIVATRQVYCWGYNSMSQLGDGGYTNRSVPTLAQSGLSATSEISAGLEHTCVAVYRSVFCWGNNVNGELGDNTVVSRPGLGNVALTYPLGIASSQNRHNCALDSIGQILCWGRGTAGQLGTGDLNNRLVPAAVLQDNGSQARQLAVGSDHSCASRTNGKLDCWGDNANGELGDASNISRTTPNPSVALDTDGLFGVDDSYSCRSLFLMHCFGRNTYGQHGNGTILDSNAPGLAVSYAGQTSAFAFVGLGLAEHHGCAVDFFGAVFCWGRNTYGQLGDNSVLDRSNPVPASGITGAVMVTAGRGHSCALLAGGTVKCWGLNTSGQLGDASYTDRLTPVAVSGLADAIAISAGGLHTCALRVNGTVVCWGNNVEGQIGNGLTANRNTFAAVMGITNAVALTASAEGNCALLVDGTVKCWGDNYYGQVGDGTNSDRLTPVMVADPILATGLQGVASLAGTSSAILNISHCAVKADGKPFCWGSNAGGKIGDSTTTNRNKPAAVLTF